MRKALFGIIVIAASSVPALAADNLEKEDYKCFLDTTAGYQISFFHWEVKKKAIEMNRLIAKRVTTPGRKSASHVKKVLECVVYDQNFASDKAKELDKVTGH